LTEEALIIKKILRSSIHDLKNLLAPVVLYSELIQEANLSGAEKENIDAILKKTDEINRYFDALRLCYHDDAWIENGSAKLLIERISLLCGTIFKSGQKIFYWRYDKDISLLNQRFKGKRIELLSKIIELAEKKADAPFWVLVQNGKEGIVWSFYEGIPEGAFDTKKEILALPLKELSGLALALGKAIFNFS
jgi:hypothetical protein